MISSNSLIFILILALTNASSPETHVTKPLTLDITSEDGVTVLGQLVLENGDHAVEKTKAFASIHGLKFDYSLNLLNALCQRDDFPCKEIVNQPITNEQGHTVVNIVVRDGESPSAVTKGFCSSLNWGFDQCDMILSHVCKATTCQYVVNMSVKVGPNADREIGQLEVYDGDDVVKRVVRFCSSHSTQMTKAECKFLIEHACGLSATTTCEILTETTVLIHLQGPKYPMTDVGQITVFRGEDPIDAVQAFCHSKNYSPEVCAFAKNQVCRDVQAKNENCQEHPIISLPIADEHNVPRGNLEVWVGQEPIDKINAFVTSKGLPKNYRNFLYRMLCEDGSIHGRDLVCTRANPALEFEFIFVPIHAMEDDRKSNSENDEFFGGTLTIFDVEDEVADSVYVWKCFFFLFLVLLSFSNTLSI